MIDGIGKSGGGRIEPSRAEARQASGAVGAPVAPKLSERSSTLGSIAAELVALGPPIDSDKVSTLRQAIADGRYRADPEAIAERMIAADLSR